MPHAPPASGQPGHPPAGRRHCTGAAAEWAEKTLIFRSTRPLPHDGQQTDETSSADLTRSSKSR